MVDFRGKPATKEDSFSPVEVWLWKIGYVDIYVKMPTPATVFYDDAFGMVILVVHPYELRGARAVATDDPKKIGATSYHFSKAKSLDDQGHPDFDHSGLGVIVWEFDRKHREPLRKKIPYWLFDAALENLFWQSKFQGLLKTHGHIKLSNYTE